EARVSTLRLVDAIEDRADLVAGLVLVTADVELHERRVPVLRDLASPDVLDGRLLRHTRDDVVDCGVERGIAGPERLALDADVLASGLLEPVVQDPVHAARLARPGRVRIDGLRADRVPDREREEHEREPAEG